MELGWDAIAGTDWTRVRHSSGPGTDVVPHLHDLFAPDPKTRSDAIDLLIEETLENGSPSTAAAPAEKVVLGLLNDRALVADADTRTRFLRFLDGIVRGAFWVDEEGLRAWVGTRKPPVGDWDDFIDDEEEVNAEGGRAILGCRELVPAIVDCAVELLNDEDIAVRSVAILALADAVPVVGSRWLAPALHEAMERAAGNGAVEERAALVIALGIAGEDVSGYLDGDEPLRLAAALGSLESLSTSREDASSPSCVRVREVLVDRLTSPGWQSLGLVRNWQLAADRCEKAIDLLIRDTDVEVAARAMIVAGRVDDFSNHYFIRRTFFHGPYEEPTGLKRDLLVRLVDALSYPVLPRAFRFALVWAGLPMTDVDVDWLKVVNQKLLMLPGVADGAAALDEWLAPDTDILDILAIGDLDDIRTGSEILAATDADLDDDEVLNILHRVTVSRPWDQSPRIDWPWF